MYEKRASVYGKEILEQICTILSKVIVNLCHKHIYVYEYTNGHFFVCV